MWINREISLRIEALARERPALVVTGARQTGKTSLLTRLFPEHKIVNLDLPSLAAEAENDPSSFLESHAPPLLIDEVQYAPGIFRHLKVDIDRHRKDNARFILTGSQKFLLMKGVSESLAGRAGFLELDVLSYLEVRRAFDSVRPEAFMLRGGFPELWDVPTLNHLEYYRSYLSTYLERDIRALVRVGSLRDFERFVRACAVRSAQLLNKSDLARDVGISPSTAGEWLSVLAASNQVSLLEPWFSNQSKSIVKSPKLYWSDPGFLIWLLGIENIEQLLRSPYLGAVWETFVYSELRKRAAFNASQPMLYFWRDRDREVDFLIHRGGRFELFEAKWSKTPTLDDTQQITRFEKMFGHEAVISAEIICRCEQSFALTPRIRAVNMDGPLGSFG